MAFSFESVEAVAGLTSADSASTDVNVIGIVALPVAMSMPPFKTTSAGATDEFVGMEKMEDPGAMVRVTPEGTKTCVAIRYEVLETRFVLAERVPPSMTVVGASVANGEAGRAVHVRPAMLPLHASHE